jgi:hypothetical protein
MKLNVLEVPPLPQFRKDMPFSDLENILLFASSFHTLAGELREP